jgi:hypothetical protein
MRRAARIDGNQNQVVKELRSIGCTVLITSQLKGCFDILVGYRGLNFCFEIKDPSKPPSQRKLTPDEQKFHDTWEGSVYIIHTIDEAIEIIISG